MQVGWVKIGDFRQITGYISKTVQDRRMVSTGTGQDRTSYALCRMVTLRMTLSDPLLPQTTTNFYILHRHSYLRNGCMQVSFKFGISLHSLSLQVQPADEKYSLKGARSGSGDDVLKFYTRVKYLRNG